LTRTATFEDEKPAVQSITPLQIAELQPGERLLVVTCSYRLANSVERDADPEEPFVLTDDSLAFHPITALFSAGDATSDTTASVKGLGRRVFAEQ
jgi:hypothetical protein